MIAARDLRLAYAGGDFVLDVPHLDVARGEQLAIVGPSGSGKTTFLHLAAGILRPDSGQLSVDGRDLDAMDDALRRRWRVARIGLVFQDLELLPYLDSLDNVLLPLRIGGGSLDAEARERARGLLADFGVAHTTHRRPARLSGGERQRVALARALVTEAPLLLLDEPTGSLDPDNAERAVGLLRARAAERGATLLMVTHDRAAAAGFERVLDAGAGLEALDAELRA
ncbi:ABC transporter ATP-binding protein [Engelhardtia mirabilis]|uniref:Lipoprotein-releasing system ATP-binding protein LolD n=1 Tax=Engelhardtia mirabilis TaxID=2528011 RepID=A0A518BKU0_9BACT|nr:Lipoprotein-releasing system ATP-binding protein LolD [Planctomycetes bacterium Pla133]QDV01915.1 Lipoprotein-releasing system ATP-binding protein LolD [Planctomycetes bacterium Pla86]